MGTGVERFSVITYDELMKRIIIVPGLGDEDTLSKLAPVIRRWEDNETTVSVFQSKWSDDESYSDKSKRLRALFEEDLEVDTYVVGYSAGGTLANAVLGADSAVKRIVFISAKLKGSDTVGEKFQKRAPALLEAVLGSEKTIEQMSDEDKKRAVCLVPLFDEVVYKKDMKIDGVKKKTIPVGVHAVAIAFALAFMTRGLLK